MINASFRYSYHLLDSYSLTISVVGMNCCLTTGIVLYIGHVRSLHPVPTGELILTELYSNELFSSPSTEVELPKNFSVIFVPNQVQYILLRYMPLTFNLISSILNYF